MAEPNITRLPQQPLNTPRTGYCHVCDRQVPLSGTDQEDIKCTICNGGFVELFEVPAQESIPAPLTRLNEALPNFIFRSIQQPVNSHRIEFVVPGGEQLDFYGYLINWFNISPFFFYYSKIDNLF
jgi:hypothetical protein